MVGRGKDRTLPAWMTASKEQPKNESSEGLVQQGYERKDEHALGENASKFLQELESAGQFEDSRSPQIDSSPRHIYAINTDEEQNQELSRYLRRSTSDTRSRSRSHSRGRKQITSPRSRSPEQRYMRCSSRSRDRSMPKQTHSSSSYPLRPGYDNRSSLGHSTSPNMTDHFLQLEKEREKIRALFMQRYNESCELYARKYEQSRLAHHTKEVSRTYTNHEKNYYVPPP